jgi:hypothetical protein
MKKNRNNIVIGIAIVCLTCLVATAQAENDPWWTQGYSADTEIETTYTYDANGTQIPQKNLANATITFFDQKTWTENDLSADEQAILAVIRTSKGSDPALDSGSLIDEVKKTLPDADVDMIQNMIGFYEYETVTGEFAYLNDAPSPLAIEIHDTWFKLYADKYPTPPQNALELEEIHAAVYTELAKHFRRTPTHIKNTLIMIEKYQEKHNIPKNVPLSEGMTMAN